MQIFDLISAYGPWCWIVAGLVLLALELVLPGGVFIWLGASAIVTGGLSLLVPIYWPLQFVIYGVLALASIALWLKVRGEGQPSDRPLLNRRAHRFVGVEVVLDEPIRDGFGRIALDDTTWRVSGPDLPAGNKVRIVDADGPILRVEPV